jgi:hypothetical protein
MTDGSAGLRPGLESCQEPCQLKKRSAGPAGHWLQRHE